MRGTRHSSAQNGTPEAGGAALSARQRKLIAALVANPDVAAACVSAGIGRSTYYRWARSIVFQVELSQERNAVLADALAAIKAHTRAAVDCLADLLKSRDEQCRRSAANDILRAALKIHDAENLSARLDALEKVFDELNRKGNVRE